MRSRRLAWVLVCVAGLAAALPGCLEREAGQLRPRLGLGQSVRVGTGGFRNVDLLLVVDDSGSMEAEQANLAVQIPALVRDLTSPPDADGDGEPDRPAAERVRVAVVSTDLGTTGAPPPDRSGCTLAGDDGALQTNAACGATAGIETFQRGQDAAGFAERIGCLVESLGLAGCGIEQQLGAAARGLEQAAAGGFPADDAILAVLVLTDEEDCTLADPAAFYAGFDRESRNVLCQRAAAGAAGTDGWLAPIDALVGRIAAGRSSDAFVFAAITGIPADASGQSAEQILARPEMQYREELSGGSLVPAPACTRVVPGATEPESAAPARRIVELASRVPGAVLHSICTDDFRPAIAELASRVAERLPSVCLARALPAVAGRVDCTLEVVPPAGEGCALPGHADAGIEPDGRAVCRVEQVPGGAGSGFFYDERDPDCAQLAFTDDAVPPLGAEVRVECYVEVPGPGGALAP